MTIMKLTGIKIAVKMPNAQIGLMSLSAFAKKATAVVHEVTNMVRKALLKA